MTKSSLEASAFARPDRSKLPLQANLYSGMLGLELISHPNYDISCIGISIKSRKSISGWFIIFLVVVDIVSFPIDIEVLIYKFFVACPVDDSAMSQFFAREINLVGYGNG